MIRKLINRLLRRRHLSTNLNQYKEYVQIGSNCNTEQLIVEIRNPVPGHIYLKIGSGSIISGRFVFEARGSHISIGENTFIGGGLFVCHDKIDIGSDVMISWGCTMSDNDAHSLIPSERIQDVKLWKKGMDEGIPWKYKDWTNVQIKAIKIDDQSWIGFNSIVLKGVKVGKRSVIGAGSVITRDIPDESVAAGNPAIIIKTTGTQ